jgi:hypothetical protein
VRQTAAGVVFADCGYWKHDVIGSDRERKAGDHDRHGGVEDAREVRTGSFISPTTKPAFSRTLQLAGRPQDQQGGWKYSVLTASHTP